MLDCHIGGDSVPTERDFQLTQKAMKIIGAKDVVRTQIAKRLQSGELVLVEQRYHREANPNEAIVYRYEHATPARQTKRRNYYVANNQEEEFEEVVEWPSIT